MSKPAARNNIWPTRDIGPNIPLYGKDKDVERLSQIIAWELRSTGLDVVGGEYYGRHAPAIIAQGRILADYYALRRGTTRFSTVMQACVAAVNNRLREVNSVHKVDADTLYEGASAKLANRWRGTSEPIAVALSYLRSTEDASAHIDAHPQQSYESVLAHLRDVPDVRALRAARHAVSHLSTHPDLSPQAQENIALTYNAVVEGYRMTSEQGAIHPIEPIQILPADAQAIHP